MLPEPAGSCENAQSNLTRSVQHYGKDDSTRGVNQVSFPQDFASVLNGAFALARGMESLYGTLNNHIKQWQPVPPFGRSGLTV